MGIIQVQWLHRQRVLGGDFGILRFRVGLFRRMLPVNISSSNVIFHAHIKNVNNEFTISYLFHKSQNISE